MRKLFLPALAVLFIGTTISSCDKIAKQLAQPASISWTGVDVTINVPPVSDTNLHGDMGTGSFTFNLDSLIKKNTNDLLGINNIDSFVLTSCMLTIQNPDANNNFANFQLAEAAFLTSVNPTSVIIGEVDNNPDVYASTLDLPINNTANLRSYLPSSGPVTISYIYGGKLRRPTTTTLTVNAHIEYRIHVKP